MNINKTIIDINTRLNTIEVAANTNQIIKVADVPYRSLSIPHYLGQRVKLDANYDSFYLTLNIYNPTNSIINWTGYQLWFNFYTENDDTLTHGISNTAFSPDEITVISNPFGNIESGATTTFRVKLDNFKVDMPEVAKSWSFWTRYETSSGTNNFGYGLIIDSMYLTPFVLDNL